MKIKDADWIQIIVIAVMVTCVVVAMQYYYNSQMRECTSNPLVYASRYYEDKYGYPFFGSGSFIVEGMSPTITFSSYGVEVKMPEQYNPYLTGFDSKSFWIVNDTIEK